MASDWRATEKRLKRQGFILERTAKRHIKITHPDHPGATYIASGTPSDHRSLANTLAGLKRIFGYDKRA